MGTLAWMTGTDVWEWFYGAPIRVVGTIIGALVLRWLLHGAIRAIVEGAIARGEGPDPGPAGRALARATGLAHERHRQRMLTVGALLRSIVTVTIGLVALLTVMALAGIPLAPLLASAGVGGIALGFGAQSLVRDFLSGILMLLEDQYGVGDIIDTGPATGTVVDVSLRITTVRDADGVVWFVRNGEITRVGNHSHTRGAPVVESP